MIVRSSALFTEILATCALLAVGGAAMAQEPCVAGTSIVTPALPTTADGIVLRRCVGMAYTDERIYDIARDDHHITLTFHWNSEVPPIVPPPESKCVYWIADIGQLPAGDYTVTWRVHDIFLDTYAPAGNFQFAVAAAVPVFGAASRVMLFVSMLVVGLLMIARSK